MLRIFYFQLALEAAVTPLVEASWMQIDLPIILNTFPAFGKVACACDLLDPIKRKISEIFNQSRKRRIALAYDAK